MKKCGVFECEVDAAWTIIPMSAGRAWWGHVYRACSEHLRQVIDGVLIDVDVSAVIKASEGACDYGQGAGGE